ncbi:ATP-dependent Clp protease proteolytic subunit [Patescibacteria group bacterium AH-259-L07]|nr:ATP-dependent Clp protease proteolytic subunit [Patescibacteria group bacterium AH-259-L07]
MNDLVYSVVIYLVFPMIVAIITTLWKSVISPCLSLMVRAEKYGSLRPESKDGVIMITADIDEKNALRIMRELEWLEYDSSTSRILIFLGSSGGEFAASWVVYHTMKKCNKPIEVRCCFAHSAAVLILAGGTKGRRFIYQLHLNKQIWVHRANTRRQQKGLLKLISYPLLMACIVWYNRSLSEAIGRPMKRIAEDTKNNTHLSAGGAVAYGFADDILPFEQEALPLDIEKFQLVNKETGDIYKSI